MAADSHWGREALCIHSAEDGTSRQALRSAAILRATLATSPLGAAAKTAAATLPNTHREPPQARSTRF